MKNHSSHRAAKGRGAQFRTPSMYKANKAEFVKHFKQPVLIKGKYENQYEKK